MIEISKVNISYDKSIVIDDLSLKIKKGEIVSLIGPNGSGKSTILNAAARMIGYDGSIIIKGSDIRSLNSKALSKSLSLLSQHNSAPEDITVEELVYYGRMPHKKWFEMRNAEDDEKVTSALINTNLVKLKDRKVSELSGGERQRAWFAMALAQKPDVLLLDEPTTYLDICHQLEVMELIKKLNEKLNLTVLMVLHDLNQALTYSSRIVVLKNGRICGEGVPEETITQELIREVYGVDSDFYKDKYTNKPIVVIKARR